MEFSQFLKEASGKVDLIPIYTSNPSCNPVNSSKKPEKVFTLKYDNPLRECPEVPGDSVLISDVCPFIHEHFCGGVHIPYQHNMKPRGRITHVSADKIVWPCGLRSIKINGKLVVGHMFVKCRCGNMYPTWISGESDFFFITCCANDTPAIKIGLANGDKCQNCLRLKRWYTPGPGFKSGISHYLAPFFCPVCTPMRDLVSNMTRFGAVSFNSPDYAEMKKNYDWKRNYPNNCELAFKSLNSPLTQTFTTVCDTVTASSGTTVTELIASINRSWCTGFKIIPINRTRILLKDDYRGRVIEFQDNNHLHNQIMAAMAEWKFL